MRNAINRGEIAGPRMQVATLAVSATGGHGDLSGFSPYLSFKGLNNIADGVDEIRKLVRTEVKYGADVIKVAATAGVLSEEESVGAPQFSQEELNALVEEAHMWEKRVAAHAHGAEGIKRAIKAGVTSVEHASFIDDEGITLAKEKGTWLVMDIYNDDYIMAEFAREGVSAEDPREGTARRAARSARTSGRPCEAGVKIAFGTDAGVYPHGWNGKQFAKMVEWGMTPTQAIKAATSRCGRSARLARPDRVGRGRQVRRPDRREGRSAEGRHGARAGELRDEGRRRVQAVTEADRSRRGCVRCVEVASGCVRLVGWSG